MATIPGMDQIDWFGIFGQIAYWTFYSIAGLVLLLVMVWVYHYLSFKYRVTVFPLYGSGKGGQYSIGKPKTNRVRYNKNKTSWFSLYPLFNKKERQPFDHDLIYNGNNIYALELGDEFIPLKINIDSGQKVAEITPVPYYIRNWQSLEHKKNAIEFAEHTWWEENKALVYGVITIAICCVLTGAVIYFTYKFAGGGRQDVQALTNALRGFAELK